MIEDAAGIGAHSHRAAEGHLSGTRRLRGEERLLPTRGHIDAKTPSGRRARLVAPDFAAELVHRPINRVAVDGGSTCVHPKPGWFFRNRDGVADQAGCEYAGILDFPPVGGVIAAIDAAACQIDDDIRAVNFFYPGT